MHLASMHGLSAWITVECLRKESGVSFELSLVPSLIVRRHVNGGVFGSAHVLLGALLELGQVLELDLERREHRATFESPSPALGCG